MFKCCSLQHNIVYVFSRTLKNERIPLLVETSFALLLMCNGGWLSLRQTTKLTHSSTLLGLPIPVKYLNSFWIIPYSVPVCLRTLKVGFCQKKKTNWNSSSPNMCFSLSLRLFVSQKWTWKRLFIFVVILSNVSYLMSLILKLPLCILKYNTALNRKENRLKARGSTTFMAQLVMATLNASFQLNLHFITYAAYELKKNWSTWKD